MPPKQTSFPFLSTARAVPAFRPEREDPTEAEAARLLLQRRIQAHLRASVVVAITDNRRTMISSDERAGTRHLRLHHMFLHADAFTLRALCRYLERGDRGSSRLLGTFIEANRHRIKASRKRKIELRTRGVHHDLRTIYDSVNAFYFAGKVDAAVTWARKTVARRRRGRYSIKLGTYCHDEKLIRIHPALDQAWVPRFFVEFIMFHEMLHHVCGAPIKNGRQCFHTPEFRTRERAYPEYERALEWEQKHIHELLHS